MSRDTKRKSRQNIDLDKKRSQKKYRKYESSKEKKSRKKEEKKTKEIPHTQGCPIGITSYNHIYCNKGNSK